MTVCYQTMKTKVGNLHIAANGNSLLALTFSQDKWQQIKNKFPSTIRKENDIIKNGISQLTEYFSGKRTAFDLPLALKGTPFQKQCWHALLSIPYGETRSYQQQANEVGNAKAARAVGSANRCNPIAIIVPCHRVIAKSGKLSGFGEGIEAKKFLLQLEGSSWKE